MLIKGTFYMFKILRRYLWKNQFQIGSNNFSPIAGYMIEDEIYQVGKQIKLPERQHGYTP